MKIINKTPHPVNVLVGDKVFTFPKSDDPVRLSSEATQTGTINEIPVFSVTYGSGNMPEQESGVAYIVSALVKKAYPDRPDLLIPHGLVRDDDGNIIGCRGFAQ
jgi:hypothetical protein